MPISKPPFGVYTPLVTFFNEDESIDVVATKQHAKRMAEGGVAGLVLQGSNGEAPHLDHGERAQIIRTIRSHLNELRFTKVKLIVGCGAASVRETLTLISEARQAGADYALVLPPAYWAAAMTPAVVENFFNAVAAEAELPFLIYNFPAVTSGIDISSDAIIRLAKANPGKIVGCKLTCGNLGKLQRVWSSLPEDEFAAFAGKSDFMLPGLVAGSNGVIAALANIVPATHVKLIQLWNEGKLQEARQLQSRLSNADGALQKVGVAGVKAVVSRYFGYGRGIGRRPLGNTSIDAMSKDVLGPLEDIIRLEEKYARQSGKL
ncbi:dihydrodipicolinate synthetase family protein [Aaosphaeria arxii CBS 175.79]|uniref:Dihydrodipicolinate synthetase family protein n=1 Tax=Aaosphaeria arxii CBS 175.79 TaxID=1450172 RepID=A0A6A5X6U5_9PLEO|nr:dihydrodipicolinate synthetase family protein [Aaosphaeria arxii CBS 175.79]KAF2008606.1 dihydrodipicolinate synthetase family protein [Aaosphaeria arxii CBS 175.79]